MLIDDHEPSYDAWGWWDTTPAPWIAQEDPLERLLCALVGAAVLYTVVTHHGTPAVLQALMGDR